MTRHPIPAQAAGERRRDWQFQSPVHAPDSCIPVLSMNRTATYEVQNAMAVSEAASLEVAMTTISDDNCRLGPERYVV